MKNLIRRYRNARKIIVQIKSGEWVAKSNYLCGGEHLTAHREGIELWLGNGASFCEIGDDNDYFGLFWRHMVWWSAARQLKKDADSNYIVSKKNSIL